jgi:hypothetical protein
MEHKEVISTKIFSLKRKYKNLEDRRIRNHPATYTVYYIPVDKYHAEQLELTPSSMVICEIVKSGELSSSKREETLERPATEFAQENVGGA